jgi:ribosomal protein L11 methyltransferase
VVAGDIDPEAIGVARGNARANGIGSLVKLYVGPGTRSPLADRRGHFDLVFANILAKPLRLLAPALARVAAPDGRLVLSGLLARDVPGVVSAYAAQGWRLGRRYDLDGWAVLVLTRSGAKPSPRRAYS